MQVEQVKIITEELLNAFQRLTPQLTTNNPPPTREDLDALLNSDSSVLLIARSGMNEPIVGSASLTIYRIPTGVRAIIEDVVVDEANRGRGIGEALVQKLLEIAWEKGAKGVALTSNPKRAAANRLYQRMGFKARETNSYYYLFRGEFPGKYPK